MGKFLSSGNSIWISLGSQRLVDCCRSRYYIDGYVERRINQVELEGKEHNTIVSLRFSITKCFRRSYNEEIIKQVGGIVLL